MAEFKPGNAKKPEPAEAWVPDWPRIYAGDPFTKHGLSAEDIKRVCKPIPEPTQTTPAIEDQHPRGPMERRGDENGESWWYHRDAHERARMRQFQRHVGTVKQPVKKPAVQDDGRYGKD